MASPSSSTTKTFTACPDVASTSVAQTHAATSVPPSSTARARQDRAWRRHSTRAAQVGTAGQCSAANACHASQRPCAWRLVDVATPAARARGTSDLRSAQWREDLRLCECRDAFAPFGARAPASSVPSLSAIVRGARRESGHRRAKGASGDGRALLERPRLVTSRHLGSRILERSPLHLSQSNRSNQWSGNPTRLRAWPRTVNEREVARRDRFLSDMAREPTRIHSVLLGRSHSAAQRKSMP
jgi:hypothetical protein